MGAEIVSPRAMEIRDSRGNLTVLCRRSQAHYPRQMNRDEVVSFNQKCRLDGEVH